MPFIPHTQKDIEEMLEEIGVPSTKNLFREIPDELIDNKLPNLNPAINEMQLTYSIQKHAKKDRFKLSFLGAGAYEHHIPAAVWDIASRGEWLSAYTPYQAEASQGGLQLLYEFQTMMANLMDMEVSNASLYDGASGLAEAILMATRLKAKKKSHRILIPKTLHPHYLETVKTIVNTPNIVIEEIPFDIHSGQTNLDILLNKAKQGATSIVVPQPNFFGVLEDADTITNIAHENDALVIACVNPLAMALLKPPGQWGKQGADIACGEGQPLGIPLSSGGPYYGFLCCNKDALRQLPGRIVGQTIDLAGQPGFVLTAQTREQHIRRGRATSNICTNQGLLVTASTIYMSLLGPYGLATTAEICNAKICELVETITKNSHISKKFNSSFFHECVLEFDQPLNDIMLKLQKNEIIAGLELKTYYPELSESLLICATETKTTDDFSFLNENLQSAFKEAK